jgi:hypothetical protein
MNKQKYMNMPLLRHIYRNNKFLEPIRDNIFYNLDKTKTVNIYITCNNYDYINDVALFILIKQFKRVNILISNTDFSNNSIFTYEYIYEFIDLILPLIDTLTFTNFNIDKTKLLKPVNNLPNTITYLDINFKKIDMPLNFLPSVLKILIISTETYNFPLDNLPSGLVYLYLNFNYSLPLDNLPINLKELTIQKLENKNLINNLPCFLKYLKIIDFYEYEFKYLPNTLEDILFPLKGFVINKGGIISYNECYLADLRTTYPKLKIITY